MYIVYFAVLHLLIDGVCALSVFGLHADAPELYRYFLLYNFCAFALQMPIGAFYDRMRLKQIEKSLILTYTGMALTLIGAFVSPVLLGLGNGLFHVGGATGALYEEKVRKWRGIAAGLFAAPGAMGVFLGQSFAGSNGRQAVIRMLLVLAILLLGMIFFAEWGRTHLPLMKLPEEPEPGTDGQEQLSGKQGFWLLLCCMLTVILRSYVGMSIVFPWKRTLTVSLCCAGALALGKVAGGILAAKLGYMRVLFFSLLLAAFFYSVSNHRSTGMLAMFFFQMTMPITLQILQERFPKQSGLMIGILSFGLFLGFLPTWLDLHIASDGVVIPYTLLGAGGSLITLAIMIAAVGICRREEA